MPRPFRAALAVALAAAAAACERPRPTEPAAAGPPGGGGASPAVAGPPTVFASGLLYPRGLTFGPDGALYVAEAGVLAGHTTLTVGQCTQVPAPLGPFRGGATGRLSRVDAAGARTTVATGLPSGVNGMNNVIGTASVAFVGAQLYALVGAGCSHGNLDVPSSVLRIAGDGSWTVAADLSAWILANPAANPEPDDFEPDGDWYSMVAAGGALYLIEANQGNLVAVDPAAGRVTRLADVSATEGHVVPTASAVAGDEILVGQLTPFPAVPGAAKVLRYARDGRLVGAITGFTAVLGVDADARGNVYVLESFTCPTAAPCFPSPASGRVTRVAADGTREAIATGLGFATSLRLGPDGALYVLTGGYGPPGAGAVVRIAAPDAVNAPPAVVALRADPALGPYGVGTKACGGRYTVCVRFQVGDADGAADAPYRVALDWGDGSAWTPNSVPAGTPLLAPHDYAAAGSYTVRVTVTDRRGASATATLVLEVLAGAAPDPARASRIVDAANDFLATYAGPRTGDLDVREAEVTFDGTTFTFRSASSGDVGTTPGAMFVWGVNRGRGTARFAAVGLAGVQFDAVVSVRPDGTGTVNDLTSGPAAISTPLPAGSVTIAGPTLTVRVPAALLPTQGLAPAAYTVNLWPRGGAGDATQLADFAPDNSNAPVRTTVP